ncbi:hypothetical protein ACH47B_06430 [Rhodococcus sp. NPDC019627]|uniref:hypothetical protein n=1 Tax=unclassified Rhodococcus (in: high G+C Gram-positive bacteria) TaxID=192944 RepID=UPI0037B7E7BA
MFRIAAVSAAAVALVALVACAGPPQPVTPTADPVVISSAVEAPPKHVPADVLGCVSNVAAGPRPTGPASQDATATYLRRLQCINGGHAVPAVEGIAVADHVCTEVLPNSPGDVDTATARMDAVANGPAPAGFSRATVLAAGAFRCPHLL